MKVKLTSWQKEVAEDKHRFKIICAGRRAGKSVLARMLCYQWAGTPGVYWIVSPTYRQAKSIHWREVLKEVPNEWIAKKNETELSITLHNGSVIELKGAENPDALRGVKLNGLIVDEIASIRNWDWLWQEVLRATLVDYEAPAIFISTPKGFNHFHDLYMLGQGDDQDYRSWRFTSYDNPVIPKGEVDAAKRTTTEDYFAQEYMADFRKYTGLVYKGFEREIHIINPVDVHDSWEIYCGVDFGSTNPTAILWIAVDGDNNWYVVREHYATGQTIDFHAGVFNSSNLRNRVLNVYGDPSGAQWINEFRQRGIYITPATKESGTRQESWVRFGIEKVAEKLRRLPGHSNGYINFEDKVRNEGLPSLYVFKSCENTIREFETYRWKEKAVTQAQDLNEPDSPEKANDHALDALRYFAVSYQRQESLPTYNDIGAKQWQIGK